MNKPLKLIKCLKHIFRNSPAKDAYRVFNKMHFRNFKYIYMGLGIWPEQSLLQKLAILSIYGIVSLFLFSQQVFILY